MELVKTKIEITVYGQKYDLSAPTALQAAEFSDMTSKQGISSVEMLKLTQEFIIKMGLPKEITEDLDLDNTKKLIEFITVKKK